MINRPEIRAKARASLGGNIFATTWLYMVLVCFIDGVLNSLGSSISGRWQQNIFATTVGSLISIAVLVLVTGPIAYGVAKISLSLVRGKDKVNLEDLFSGYKENFTASMLLGLLKTIFLFLWTLLFIIPGIIKSYSYSMAFYIQQDSENKDWNYCITESRKRMNGHKAELFVLDLSFLGWYIVGFLCLGVGVLWVSAYHTLARTHFYETVIAEKKAEPIVEQTADFAPQTEEPADESKD